MMSVDQGVKTSLTNPLQSAGNVFVVKKDLPMNNWQEFVGAVKGAKGQFRIGIPGPATVASIILKSALKAEGVTFSEDRADKKADVLLVNMKGHGNVTPGMANGVTQGLVAAQPFPALAVNQGVGKFILNLQDVPGGQWKGHACCSAEVVDSFAQKNRDLVVKATELLVLGAKEANLDPNLTAQVSSAWLGVTPEVEKMALPGMDFLTTPTAQWSRSIYVYAKTMDQMGLFSGQLKGKRGEKLNKLLFNFQYLKEAKKNLKQKKYLG
jgi:NitT/TauT family transport system substrate-binding protein